ncbi:MAG: PCMD domain-containing protein [Alistipes sp.]|nr:PCMD domain-containing protein [Alistipes sp.]
MNRWKYILFMMVNLMCLSGCIKNTIPYPVEKMDILAFEGEGFKAAIDPARREVVLTLEEQTNIAAVKVTKVEVTEGATASAALVGVFDMRSPREVTLSRYQDYVWTIRAQQSIERYFTVMGQVGEAVIDEESRTATAYVGEKTDLENITVVGLKLGPKDVTTITPSLEELTDFRSVRYVYLQYPALEGQTERWQLYVLPTDVKAQITQADAWATIAWLYGAAEEGNKVGFKYRQSGSEQWLDAPEATIDGGTFRAKIEGLTPQTTYEFVAYSNDDLSPVVSLTTEEIVPLVNGGFERWSTKSNVVYPYADNDEPFWGTGNVGASLVGATLTEGVEEARPGSNGTTSARLSSTFASAMGVGKFAAGNLFVGSYVKNDGTHGIVNFGRKFTARPTALKGWLKYNCGAVDRITSQPPGETIEAGDNDCGMIFIALGDWDAATYGGSEDSPVEIATRRIDETAFNPESDAVIAYGEMPLAQSIGQWQEFEIKLDYRATNRIPTHIIIVCSASRYGDYFTGSTQSVLWLDDFELIYE